MEKINIFISHHHKDYELAKEIKEKLGEAFFDVFLAHKDIEPTKEWQDEIYTALKKCDVLIPLLTEDFKKSDWTEQEVGIAFGNEKKIISIIIDIVPFGFMGKWQGYRFDKAKEKREYELEKFIYFICSKLEITREIIISCLKDIYSYKQANLNFKILNAKQPFNKEEIKKIIEHSIDNNQINEAGYSSKRLIEWVKKYDKDIESELKEKMMRKLDKDFLYDYRFKKITNLTGINEESLKNEIEERLKKYDNSLSKYVVLQLIAEEKGILVD